MKFQYKAFGLHIDSEIEIPEFSTSSFDLPDIQILVQKTPDILQNPTAQGVLFDGTKNDFLLRIPDTGKIYVTHGKTIYLDKRDHASWNDIRVFLLSSGMGALLHQRTLLPMHASTIEINQKAYMFMGHSGTGKSTLAAAFAKHGAHVLADDISLVQSKETGTLIIPSFPQIKLWGDAVKKLEDNPGQMRQVRAELGKYWKYLDNNFSDEPRIVDAAFVLSPVNNNQFTVTRITGIDKFNVLKNNTYKIRFIRGTGLEKQHFTNVSKLANGIDVYKIERPSGSFELSELVNIISNHLNAPVH